MLVYISLALLRRCYDEQSFGSESLKIIIPNVFPEYLAAVQPMVLMI